MNQPSPQLYLDIVEDIHYQEKLLRLKQRLFWDACGFIVSVCLTVMCGRLLWLELQKSEFLQFLALARTDFSIIKTDSGNFILALAESFPVLGGFLAAAAALLVVWFSVTSMSVAFKIKQLTHYFA